MPKANFIRRNDALVAVDDNAREALQAIKEGREVCILVKGNRNPRFHRFFFAFLGDIVDAGAWDGDTDSLLDWVKLKTFHVEPVIVAGQQVLRLKSINFESMSEGPFRRFYQRAENALFTQLLAGPEWQPLRNEVNSRMMQRMGDPRDVAA